MFGRLCAILGCSEKGLVGWNQMSIKKMPLDYSWKQATNGNYFGADWLLYQVHQNLSCSFRKSTALISAQIKPLKTCSSSSCFFKKKKTEAMACSPCPSIRSYMYLMKSFVGSKGGWSGLANLKTKLLVQELLASGYKKEDVKKMAA
ncbi:hypothetical protein DY000_02021052 [Brassica cretica]|uniref:Uncharacterized protein n=1 Tax=Brassica cretica TaxID=69181 RepID=A0ABQ7EAH0_BRACR|nr:hypothetical protein DY000_02021052 [Brassica cretica]